ncbi:hypothetical protein Tco_1307198, partial [Tanacetum coccineum]
GLGRLIEKKRKNDILDGMEGIVEDVLDDISLAARAIVADELNGSTNTGMERRVLWKDLQMAKSITNVEALRDKLKAAQLDVSLFPHDVEKKKLAALTLDEYQEAMDDEEKLLFQCAKVDWLNEGDRTTAYFHKGPKLQKNLLTILITSWGQSTHVDLLDTLGDIFTTTLTNKEAIAMVKEVTDQEKNNDMFGIGDCKAPGPDGYTTWDLDRGKAKIAWKTLCKPKAKDGLGFKALGKWNELRMMSIKVLDLVNVQSVAKDWNITFKHIQYEVSKKK